MTSCIEDQGLISTLAWLGISASILTLLHVWATTAHTHQSKYSLSLPKTYVISHSAALAILSTLAILVLDIDQAKENTPLARTTKKILSWLWVVLALMTRIITFDIFRQALWGLQLPRRSLGSAPGDAITIAQKEGKMHFNLLVKAEAIVVVCTITLGVLQILIPAWIDYHKTIVF
jgi:beta-lactamase regulating signal transducer with metallopeptidase domain